MAHLTGLHDRGGEHLLGGRGWVLVTEAIGCDQSPVGWDSVVRITAYKGTWTLS